VGCLDGCPVGRRDLCIDALKREGWDEGCLDGCDVGKITFFVG